MNLEEALVKIKDLESANATLTKDKDEAVKKVSDFETSNKKLGEDLKKKDEIIEQKNKDIVGARRETQKLKELSEDEKKEMSETEIRIHGATLKLQKDQEDFAASQKEAAKKEVTARQESVINRISHGNPELAAKIRENFSRLNPEFLEKATTEAEIAPLVEDAYRLIPGVKPDPINGAINSNGGEAPDGQRKDDFSTTDEGKAVLAALGLPTEDPKTPAA